MTRKIDRSILTASRGQSL